MPLSDGSFLFCLVLKTYAATLIILERIIIIEKESDTIIPSHMTLAIVVPADVDQTMRALAPNSPPPLGWCPSL